MAYTTYYDKYVPEALMRELKTRVEGRLREKLIPLAEQIIAEEVSNSAINLMEWVSSNFGERQISIVIQQPKHETVGDVIDGKNL